MESPENAADSGAFRHELPLTGRARGHAAIDWRRGWRRKPDPGPSGLSSDTDDGQLRSALEGGVAYGDERTQRMLSGSGRDREGGGRLGIPVLSSLLRLDMSGRWAQKEHEEGSEEIKVVRQHTEASLFNLLRHRLVADGKVAAVNDERQLDELVPGQLIENVRGSHRQSAPADVRPDAPQILPYIGVDEDQLRKPPKSRPQGGNPRSGNPAKRAPAQQKPDAASSSAGSDDECRWKRSCGCCSRCAMISRLPPSEYFILEGPGGSRLC